MDWAGRALTSHDPAARTLCLRRTLCASRLRIVCDMSTDGLEVGVSFKFSAHVGRTPPSPNWLACIRTTRSGSSTKKMEDFNGVLRFRLLALMRRTFGVQSLWTISQNLKPRPLAMSALLSTLSSGAKSLHAKQPLLPPAWKRVTGGSSSDEFFTARVLLYVSPTLAPASTTADVSIGTVAVILNRDLLAAIVSVIGDIVPPTAQQVPSSVQSSVKLRETM